MSGRNPENCAFGGTAGKGSARGSGRTEVKRSIIALGLASATLCLAPGVASGQTVRADFDGDGREDLAVGVPGESVGAIPNAGAVSVLYGSGAGLNSVGDQLWHQDSAGVEGTAQSADGFGYSVTAGDFTGDGFDDLAVGVPFEGVGQIDEAGVVNVIYGSSTGLNAAGDQLFRGDADMQDAVLGGDHYGRALAAGDFDDDGTEDLAVGAPSDDRDTPFGDPSFRSDVGSVGAIYGSGQGLDPQTQEVWHQDLSGIEDTGEEGDRFGLDLVAANFDSSPADLAIAAPVEKVSGRSAAGAVNLIRGATGAGLVSAGDEFWHQDSNGIKDTARVGELFGSLAAGDFDGDGRADLSVGVLGEDVGGKNSAGAVNVIYGAASGLDAAGDQFWHQNRPGIADSAQRRDHFGDVLAAGDFDGDGRDDLAAAPPLERVGGKNSAGAVNVIYGAASGLDAAGDQFWHQNRPGIADSAERLDTFGFALTTGRFDGNGKADLVAGVPFENLGPISNGGATNVIYGSGAGLDAMGDQLWHQNRPGIAESAEAGDKFGAALVDSLFED